MGGRMASGDEPQYVRMGLEDVSIHSLVGIADTTAEEGSCTLRDRRCRIGRRYVAVDA